MNQKQRIISTSIAALLIVALAVSCGPAPTPQVTEAPPIKQEIVYLVAEALDPIRDPQGHFYLTGFPVQRHFLDPLVERNDKLEIVPALAESWENPDPNTWVFHLRQGVKFHNGEEFTADSVKATLERVVKPETGQSFLWVPLTVEVQDKYTAVVKTEQPFGALLANLAITEMLPPSAIADMEAFGKQPIGTGCFKVVSLSTDELVLEAFDECWRGAPKIRKLTFKYVQDPNTRVAALLSGEAQIADRIPYDLIRVAEADPEIDVQVVPSTEMLYLRLRPTVAPWTDKRARQALAYAIDRQGIVDTILSGVAKVASAPVSLSVFGYASGLPQYEYNPEKARALLQEAGVPEGTPFEILVSPAAYAKVKEVAEAIAAQLQEVGLDARVRAMEQGAWIQAFLGGEGQAWIAGWGVVTADSQFGMFLPFHSSATGGTTKYANPEVDALLEAARGTADPAARLEAYQEAQAIIWDELPQIPLYESPIAVGVNWRVQNFQVMPNFYNLVTVETELK